MQDKHFLLICSSTQRLSNMGVKIVNLVEKWHPWSQSRTSCLFCRRETQQNTLSSFPLASPIFIGSRVSDKYPCPLISMYPERQIIVVDGWQQCKWEFHWQRFNVNPIREHKRPLKKKSVTKGSKVNENRPTPFGLTRIDQLEWTTRNSHANTFFVVVNEYVLLVELAPLALLSN